MASGAEKELTPSSTFDLIPSMVPGRSMVLLPKVPNGCIQALENYRSTKTKSKHLSVFWNGTSGVFKIATGEDEKDCQHFALTIGETTGKVSTEPNKNVEDILRTSSDRGHQLQAVGTVTCKVKVKARQSEVFTCTRENIRTAEQSRRAVCAQEIEVTSRQPRKTKTNGVVVKGANRRGAVPPSNLTSSAASSASKRQQPIAGKSALGLPSADGKYGGGRSALASASSSGSATSLSRGTAKKPDLKSLRGMLTFILAPKPLKKSEILSRLSKADKKYHEHRDESRLYTTLDAIATSSHDLYHLKAELLQGLQVSKWPHYTETEKLAIQRRLKFEGLDDAVANGSNSGAASTLSTATPASASHTSTPSPSDQHQQQQLRSPYRSVAGLVDDLGLSGERSPSSQLTPLSSAHVRSARQQQQQQQSHTSSVSAMSASDDGWVPTTTEKLKHNSTPATRRATLSKAQTNMLAASSKARHGNYSNAKTNSRLKASSGASGSGSSGNSTSVTSSPSLASSSASSTATSTTTATTTTTHSASEQADTASRSTSNTSAATGAAAATGAGGNGTAAAATTSTAATSNHSSSSVLRRSSSRTTPIASSSTASTSTDNSSNVLSTSATTTTGNSLLSSTRTAAGTSSSSGTTESTQTPAPHSGKGIKRRRHQESNQSSNSSGKSSAASTATTASSSSTTSSRRHASMEPERKRRPSSVASSTPSATSTATSSHLPSTAAASTGAQGTSAAVSSHSSSRHHHQPKHHHHRRVSSGAAAAAAGGGDGAAAAAAIGGELHVDMSEDWTCKYSEVTSYAVRCSYKNDFNSAYPLYCKLKSKMDMVMEEFQILEEQWKEAEGTPEEDKVYEKVIALHDKYMRDSTFKSEREKLQFLHNKLSHIKTLIGVYDSQLLAQS